MLERFTGIGVGRLMMQHAVEVLKGLGYDTLFLTVYHENSRALKFYQQYGFTDAGHTYFEMEGNRYENRVLVLSMKAGSLKQESHKLKGER